MLCRVCGIEEQRVRGALLTLNINPVQKTGEMPAVTLRMMDGKFRLVDLVLVSS